MCLKATRRKTRQRRRKTSESTSLSAAHLGLRRTRLAAGTQLSHAVLSASRFDPDRSYHALLHFEDLSRLRRSAILAMERPARGLAHGAGGVELFLYWL